MYGTELDRVRHLWVWRTELEWSVVCAIPGLGDILLFCLIVVQRNQCLDVDVVVVVVVD